jgi:hypothetical protein
MSKFYATLVVCVRWHGCCNYRELKANSENLQ